MLCTLGGTYISYTLKEHKDYVSSLWNLFKLEYQQPLLIYKSNLEKCDYFLPPCYTFP